MSTTVTPSTDPPEAARGGGDLPAHVRVAVIGAGFGGLGAAIALRQSGIDDFIVLERAEDVGGTWRDNHYPGCACDVPSHLYSFSFAPNPDWTRTFSRQPEIWAYLRDTARRFDVLDRVRFGAEMLAAEWDESDERWHLSTARGSLTADAVIAAPGGLSEPSIPELPGIERFGGTLFHTARWNDDHDLTGERVAVIGTGASSIQVVPSIAPKVGRLTVFQRTPAWVMPRMDRAIPRWRRRLFRHVPALQGLARGAIYWSREMLVLPLMHPVLMKRLEQVAKRHLATQVRDPRLRARLTPDYRMGCKRILISNEYLPTFNRTNVQLVSSGISEIRESSILAEDGTEHEVDTIILATGFHVTDFPAAQRIRGRGGRLLAEDWRNGSSAYRGTTVTGFPNLFLITGPNTGLGHNSMVFMIEAQLQYVIDALRTMDAFGLRSIEVRPGVQEAYDAHIQRRLKGSVWSTGGCASWYLDANGRNTTLWPGFTWPFRRQMRRFDVDGYAVTPEHGGPAEGAAQRSSVAATLG